MGQRHQAQLVWVVQALVDRCAEFTDGQCLAMPPTMKYR
jgi:hypothetical protein